MPRRWRERTRLPPVTRFLWFLACCLVVVVAVEAALR